MFSFLANTPAAAPMEVKFGVDDSSTLNFIIGGSVQNIVSAEWKKTHSRLPE